MGSAVSACSVARRFPQRLAQRLSFRKGEFYRGLKLSDKLSSIGINSREVEHADRTDLSLGTQERLVFLTRLCLTEMLSEKHARQCLILDDSLVHTDENRMAMALKMLSEFALSSQVLVLTCHPERFSRLELAKSFELISP